MAIISFIVATFALVLLNPSNSLHLEGIWRSDEVFFKFLTRFGFQQTFDDDKSNTEGYIYGNIILLDPQNDTVPTSELVVVDSEYFLDFYGNRNLDSGACPAMFNKIDTKVWDPICNPSGKEDFLRPIPCPVGRPCLNGTKPEWPEWLIPGYQFTYRVDDVSKPSFWYVSMVGCSRNTSDVESCFWSQEVAAGAIKYDIWLVNGHPNLKHMNPFEHQFSFEMHDIFEMYAAFFVLYTFLMPIQLYTLSKQRHLLPLLLTVCMCLEYVGILFNLLHVLVFAFDGEGIELLSVVGNFVDNVAQCLFMLLLLLVVKGWTITRMHLETRSKVVLFTLWGNYTIASMALFVWNLMEIDIISDIGEWQTWPGYIILTFRIAIMAWFLLELRETFMLEHNTQKVRFYLHFGAGFLVWFVYLPIAALICAQLSALWRYKTMLSITYAADFVSYCVMIHLLWPDRSYAYFNLSARAPPIALDDFTFKGLMDTSADSASEESLDMHELSKLIKGQKAGQKSATVQNGRIPNSATSATRFPRFSDDSPRFDEQTTRFDECDATGYFCKVERISVHDDDIENDDVFVEDQCRSDTNVLVEVDLHDSRIARNKGVATSHDLRGEVLPCADLEHATKELL